MRFRSRPDLAVADAEPDGDELAYTAVPSTERAYRATGRPGLGYAQTDVVNDDPGVPYSDMRGGLRHESN